MVIERDDDSGPGNLTEQTVSELSGAIKRTVEERFGLVRVRGEIGRVSTPRSGHVYLSLKDDRAVMDGVIWKGVAARLPVKPEEGLEVIVNGKLTTFPGQSKYQIVIESMEPAGAGALMAMLEARKKALTAEGLFAPERKKPLPAMPKTIGVVTSPSGAVIRDILHRLSERFPCEVLVWPVAVQGQKCASEVAAAIRGFDALAPGGPVPRPDVLIVARGGGSIEDLWGFNEEIVVRAAAECRIPLISAVGHETDVTLIDHAADLRAPTPTAAAEKAVPVRVELLASVADKGARRLRAMDRIMRLAAQRVEQTSRLLPKPATMIAERRQRLDIAGQGLPRALQSGLAEHRAAFATIRASLRPAAMTGKVREARGRLTNTATRLAPQKLLRLTTERATRLTTSRSALQRTATQMLTPRRDALRSLSRTLEAMSYHRVLDRGFAVVRDVKGKVITTAKAAKPGAQIAIEFAGKQQVDAVIGGSVAPQPARKKPKAAPAAQTPDLFGE